MSRVDLPVWFYTLPVLGLIWFLHLVLERLT